MQTRQLIRLTFFPAVLAISLSAVDAGAVDLKSVLDQQQEVQKRVSDPGNTEQNAYPPDQQPSAMKECIQALCPVSTDNPSYEALQDQVQAEAAKRMPSDFAEIRGTLSDWASSSAGGLLTGVNAFKKLADSGKLKIDPAYQTLHNVLFLAAEIENGSAVLSDQSTNDNLIVDPTKTKVNLKDLPENDQKWMVNAFQGFYNLPEMHEYLQIGNNSGLAILKQKYPDLSLVDALKKVADELDAASLAVAKKNAVLGLPPTVLSLAVPKSMVDAARSGKLQDEASLESFLQQATMSLAFSSMIVNPDKYAWLGGRSGDSLVQMMKSGGLANRAQALQSYFKGPQFGKSLANIFQNCVGNYSQNAVALPTDAELGSAKAQADGVIADLNSRVFSKLSTHTAAMLAGVFAKTEVFFPRTFSGYKNDFISDIQEGAAQSKAASQYLSSHPGTDGDQFALLNAYNLVGSDWTPDGSVSQFLNDCDDYKLGSLDDRANQAEAVFWASWLSVKNTKLGKAVMAHEMGHIMDTAMVSGNASVESFGKYKAVEDCLRSKHPEPAAPVNISIVQAQGNKSTVIYGQYSVEDYADQIAGIAEPDTNFGCLLLTSDDRNNPSAINSQADDTHSSDVFRALFSERIRKGGLSKVCTDALSVAGTPRDFSSCF